MSKVEMRIINASFNVEFYIPQLIFKDFNVCVCTVEINLESKQYFPLYYTRLLTVTFSDNLAVIPGWLKR